jgi:preprotein translocase subunit SecA
VGTISIDVSEQIAGILKKRGIKHNVLNAKNHEAEAEIISNAGQSGAVTISTNMAGRGTDIKLGEGVTELGGLHILGTERHESRRIDNQLRGRSGRQGDPGSSRFFLSLEDDLLRIFGGERISGIMERLGMEEGEPIEHNLISRAIENAQSKVEGHNFDIRKHLLEYDDVMNQQREVIYRQRRDLLMGEDIRETIQDMIGDKAEEIAADFADERTLPEDWDHKGLSDAVFKQYNFRIAPFDKDTLDGLTAEGLSQNIYEQAMAVYAQREKSIGPDTLRHLERVVMLQTVDNLWKDHLLSMDHLKEGIGLRGYAQQNPLIVYKKEGFDMFQGLIERIKEETIAIMFRIQLAEPGLDLNHKSNTSPNGHLTQISKPTENDRRLTNGPKNRYESDEAKQFPNQKKLVFCPTPTDCFVREVVTALAGCDHILHAGDIGENEVLDGLERIAPVVAVRGNMDYGSWSNSLPPKEMIEIGGIFFYILHDLNQLDLEPSAAGIHVVVSGHTHQPHLIKKMG